MHWKTWTSAVVVITAMSVPGVLAQNPSPSTPTPGAGAATDALRSGKVAIVGCLERGDQMMSSSGNPSTTGTTGTRSAESSSYILKAGSTAPAPSATGSPASGASGASATGSAGAAAASGAAPASAAMSNMANAGTFSLEGREQDLSPHVNHQVEITGTLVNASASSPTGATGAAATPGGAGSAGAAANVSPSASTQRLRVDSVRMIASTCATK